MASALRSWPRHRTRALRARCRAPPRRLPRPRASGIHRIVVSLSQGALRLAPGVRDPRASPGGERSLHRALPRPAPQPARLPGRPARSAPPGTVLREHPRPEPSTPAGSAPPAEVTGQPRARLQASRRPLPIRSAARSTSVWPLGRRYAPDRRPMLRTGYHSRWAGVCDRRATRWRLTGGEL